MANDDQKKNLEGQVNSKASWVVFYTSPTDTGGLLPLWAGSFNEKQRMEACDRYVTEFILKPAALLGAVQNVKADCKAQMDALPADHPHRGNYRLMYDSLEEQEIAIADGLRRHADLTTKLPQFTPEIAQVVVQAVHNTILRIEKPRVEETNPSDRTIQMGRDKWIKDFAGYRKEIADIRASLEATAEGFAESTHPHTETPPMSLLDKAIENYPRDKKTIGDLKTDLEQSLETYVAFVGEQKPEKDGA